MSASEETIPPDQFDRVLNEMTKLSRLFDEVERSIAIARGIHRHEAQRALDEARSCVEVAQYWMAKAIHAAKGRA
jgi:uncharacterized protein (DUF1015 family)